MSCSGGKMTREKRAEPYLPSGPARDLVDLFKRLRDSNQLRIGQIANRTGYAPGHISEVLRGFKAPSPDAAARIAQVLGGDDPTAMRARRYAEDLKDWKRNNNKRRPHTLSENLPEPDLAKFPVYHQMSSPNVALDISIGDLLDQETHLAVGFSDTFDTSTGDDRIIHRSSIQGQLLRRLFANDQNQLDEQLTAALADISPLRVESRQEKPCGKLARYPLGTVAVLGESRRRIFAVAYGSMGNDLVVRAPVDNMWHCYTQLWEAVYSYGQRGVLSIPIMGSGLARIDTLDHENILRLILLSFVAYSRLKLICRELRIVIPPADARRIDPLSIRAFLRTL
jgi:transcriptional regulator with XRE-family HTH domain